MSIQPSPGHGCQGTEDREEARASVPRSRPEGVWEARHFLTEIGLDFHAGSDLQLHTGQQPRMWTGSADWPGNLCPLLGYQETQESRAEAGQG